jgi:hypothetical protein
VSSNAVVVVAAVYASVLSLNIKLHVKIILFSTIYFKIISAFNTAFSTAAIQFQAKRCAIGLIAVGSTCTEVDTYDPVDAGLSTGEYAGIVIGVLVAFIVLGAIVFLLFKRRSEESAHSAVSTSSQV